jgi:hypothetical protein
MFYKKVFGSFSMFYPEEGPQSCVEEDLHVLKKLELRGTLGLVQSGWHYIYVYHGTNTYGISHHNLTLDIRSGKKVLGVDELLKQRSRIEESWDLAGINRRIWVKSLDGIAFTLEAK